MAATHSPRTRSEAIMTLLRGSRSVTAPPTRAKPISGSVRANSTSDSVVALRDCWRVCQAKATVKIPSPSCETAWPLQSQRNSRLASGRAILIGSRVRPRPAGPSGRYVDRWAA